MKHKRWLNAFFAFLGFAVVGWMAFDRPSWLLALGIFTSLPGYFLLFAVLTPAGSLRFGSKEEKLPTRRWLYLLLAGHFVLLLFTVAVYLAFFGAGPMFVDGRIPFSFAENVVKEYTRWQWGIFPWGVYGIWAFTIAYVAYIKNAPPFVYSMIRGFCPKRLEPMVKTFVEASAQGATVLGITLVVCAIVLLISYSFESLIGTSHLLNPPITFSFLSLFMIFFLTKGARLKMRHWQGKGSLNLLILFCIVGLVGLIILASAASRWFLINHPEIQSQIKCNHCSNYFGTTPIETRFAALYWGWWLVWTPLAGSYLAKITKGRTLREFVIGLLFFPALFWLILKGLACIPWHSSHVVIPKIGVFGILVSLPFIVWLVLSKILKNAHNSSFLQSGYMPVSPDFKVNRLWLKDASKVVGISKYGPKIVLSIFATLLLHTTAGWYGIQIQVTAMAVMVINAVYSAFDFTVLRFFKDKIWMKNQNI